MLYTKHLMCNCKKETGIQSILDNELNEKYLEQQLSYWI